MFIIRDVIDYNLAYQLYLSNIDVFKELYSPLVLEELNGDITHNLIIFQSNTYTDVFENEPIKIPTPSLSEINDWLTKKYKILIRVHEHNSQYIYTIETVHYKTFGKIFYPKPEDALREGIVRYLKYKFFRKRQFDI